MNRWAFSHWASIISVMMVTAMGCHENDSEYRKKAARPVTTIALQKTAPPSPFFVAGAVKSWKTEQIGFEVPGRVQWVLEPGKNVEGQISDAEGNLIPGKQGTALAQIDSGRYEIAKKAAQANWQVSTLKEQVVRIQLKNFIESEIPAAESEVKVAQADFDRISQLRRLNAISQAELDEATNRLKSQTSRLTTLQSSQKQSEAELTSAEAATMNANQAREDADRDLQDTTLRASYRGQISEVHVVPGSVVSAGSPVVTLQMMDPIKIEVEVSAAQSREIQRRRQVPISYPLPDGSLRQQNAFVYMVDPSADPSTRTFTVVLLVINEQYRPELPERLRQIALARTKDIWPLKLNELIGFGNRAAWFIEENCIQTDANGSYVWLLDEVRFGEDLPEVVKLKKFSVTIEDLRVPFLGNWILRPVVFADPSIGETRIVAGPLEYPGGDATRWDGESLMIDHGPQWRLRPGDLVNVNLSNQDSTNGYFVPVEAIYEELNATYVFVVEQNVARRTPVQVHLPRGKLNAGSMIRIEPLNSSSFPEETHIVLGGVHYLHDGQEIKVVRQLTPDSLADDLRAPTNRMSEAIVPSPQPAVISEKP